MCCSLHSRVEWAVATDAGIILLHEDVAHPATVIGGLWSCTGETPVSNMVMWKHVETHAAVTACSSPGDSSPGDSYGRVECAQACQHKGQGVVAAEEAVGSMA